VFKEVYLALLTQLLYRPYRYFTAPDQSNVFMVNENWINEDQLNKKINVTLQKVN
jgi:quinol monooxygenase YgiN